MAERFEVILQHLQRFGGFRAFLAFFFPHLHGDVQVARFQAGELGDVVGLNVFDIVTGFFQYFAHDAGRDELAGPVMEREFDRIV